MNNSENQKEQPMNNIQGRRKQNDSPKTQTLVSVIDDLIIRFIMNCPDEVFESFDRLFFQIEEAHWFYEDFYREQNKTLPSLNFKQFVDEIFKQCPALQPYRETIDKHTQSFYDYKNTVPVFGAIILNQTRDKVLLVKGWNSKTWSFPRGKVNQDESEMVCAAREVKEEIGFDISPYLNSKNYLKMHFNEQVVTLFIVSGVPENTKFHPETRKEVSAIEWHSIDEIVNARSPSNPKKCASKYWIISSFMPRLKKWLAKNPESNNNKNHSSKRKLSPKSSELSPSTEMDKKRGRRGRKSPSQSPQQQQQPSSTTVSNNGRKLTFENKAESAPVSILRREAPAPAVVAAPITSAHPGLPFPISQPVLSSSPPAYHAPYMHGMYPYPPQQHLPFMYNYVPSPYPYSYAPHMASSQPNRVIV